MFELRDVVLVVGPAGREEVVLCGADWRVRPGSMNVLRDATPLQAEAIGRLLSGRLNPRYGTLTTTHQAGKVHLVSPALPRRSTARVASHDAIVVLAGEPPAIDGSGVQVDVWSLHGGQIVAAGHQEAR